MQPAMDRERVCVTFMLDGHEAIPSEKLRHHAGDRAEQATLFAVERVMLRVVRNHIYRRVGDLSCPRHGQGPRIVATGPAPDRLTFSVEGCCQNLVDCATIALEEDAPRPGLAV